MVVIRLARGGTKKRPFYHIVVSNSRDARDGRFIERLGFYNPIAAGEEIKLQLNKERIDYWLSKGAQPSEKVAYLIDNFAEIAMGKEPIYKKPKPKKAKETKATKLAEEEKIAPEEKVEEPEVKKTEEKPEKELKEKPKGKPKEKPEEKPKEEPEETTTEQTTETETEGKIE
jgi:small subunit ribosomal protein S16